jgi:GTPase involved in cell partitioning and DNA repair
MNRRQPKLLALPAGVKWDELEFADDAKAIAKEVAKFDRKAREKAAALGKTIAADLERERQELLAKCIQQRAEDLAEIAALELEEKMQSAIEADRAEAQRVFNAYIERLTVKFRAAVQEQGKWLEENKGHMARIQKDINRSTVRAERNELLRRGAVRGRRG